MSRKFMVVMLLSLFMVAAAPTLAQSNWFVYLYNGNTKDLVRINPDGSQIPYNLGLDSTTFVSSFDMTFTQDGNRVAFCAVTYPAVMDASTPAQPFAKLYLRDIPAGANTLDMAMGNAIGCRTGRDAFNPDANQLAVSKINYYPGAPDADTSQPTWELLILNTADGSVVRELNASSPAVQSFESLAKGGVLPYVQYFENNQIIFAEVPYGIGGGAEWNAYLWDLNADTIQPIDRWGNFSLDTLPTGELIWVTSDLNLPAGQPGGPVPANNVVKVADKSGSDFTIYHSPDWVILDTKFIDDGARAAVQLLSPFDPNATNQLQTLRWIALDRAGGTTDLVSSNGSPTIMAAPGGFVLLNQQIIDQTTGTSDFTLTYSANGQTNNLWSASVDPAVGYWELAWATPATAAQGLSPFTPVSG
jgi:hypothetical protein